MEPSARARASGSAVGVLLAGVMLVGVLIAFSGATWGIVLTIAGLAMVFALDLVIGIRSYRWVMRRPWPRVQPVEDDDDDW
jgi:hypothetical protein